MNRSPGLGTPISSLFNCNDPRAAGTPDRVVTDLILVMEKSEECRSEWVQEIPRVPQSREHKCLQLYI